jgi:hypothetical protein
MVLVNFVRSLFIGLAIYCILGITFNDAIHWHWVNYVAYAAIWFGGSMAADFAELALIKWFDKPEVTDDTFRG